jgi:hypothetical protein
MHGTCVIRRTRHKYKQHGFLPMTITGKSGYKPSPCAVFLISNE